MDLERRFRTLAGPGLLARLRWRSGSLADYQALACYHYRPGRPATVCRVLVVEDTATDVVGRFTGRAVRPRPVGVLVESMPVLHCSMRNWALGGRYGGWSDRALAARLLNAEMRCISRVVVHPQWRGLGLAVALVRRALATRTTPMTEAMAAMGRVHPFFVKAGMIEYRPLPSPADQRLLDALASAGLKPWDLADGPAVRGLLAGSSRSAVLLRRELARWAGAGLGLDEQLARARRRLWCRPVYYLKGPDDE